MRFITADVIFPISSASVPKGVVVVDNEGIIAEITTRDKVDSAKLEIFEGIILPGFINTHCHLELSHMKGVCPTGTQLIPFITRVVQLRDADKQEVQAGIKRADSEMWLSGIQAVGDISNKIDTASCKNESPIKYYTFVEMFDFMNPALTEGTVENYRNVFKDQSSAKGNKKSFVPHAPYSVSKGLFDFINKANPSNAVVSIHNQETPPENELFLNGTGSFIDFFNGFNMPLNEFKPLGKSSIHYILENLNPFKRNIFVHNTLTNSEDIQAAHKWSEEVYWATCPNANLFIENRLPNYQHFLDKDAKVTMGTDSIMSNWQLSVWEEIKTIRRFQSYVPLENLFSWATINGAKALGFEKRMGSIEKGKQPGLVHVNCKWKGEDSDILKSESKRII